MSKIWAPFQAEWADGSQSRFASTLVRTGAPQGEAGGYTAMAETVGMPCALAVRLGLGLIFTVCGPRRSVRYVGSRVRRPTKAPGLKGALLDGHVVPRTRCGTA